MFLPNKLKRLCYIYFCDYNIDSTSRIGFSLIMAKKLIMKENARIGHLSVIKSLSEVSMGECSSIGNLNWISGFPENSKSPHFADQPNRKPKLIIGKHSAITNRHLVDCTDTVSIGDYSTFAGFRSQILTHSISIHLCQQQSGPVSIGDYTFVGTGVVMLPNTSLPNYSVLAAGAILNKRYVEEFYLYAGNPARPVKSIDSSVPYFKRTIGYIL